jgi:hypothetical protein
VRAAAIVVIAFSGLDDPVFLTSDGAGSGLTTSILFVSTGRETGELSGVEDERDLVLSFGDVLDASGSFVGRLDMVFTNLCRS